MSDPDQDRIGLQRAARGTNEALALLPDGSRFERSLSAWEAALLDALHEIAEEE